MRKKTIYDTYALISLFIRKEYKGYEKNKQGNLFIEDNTLYSYGYHYPMATWVKNKEGNFALDVYTKKRSKTTEGHKNILLYHLPLNVNVLYRKETETGSVLTIFAHYEDMQDVIEKHMRSKSKKEEYSREIVNICAKLKNYADFYDMLKSEPHNKELHKIYKEASEIITWQKFIPEVYSMAKLNVPNHLTT